uniref:Uncharacterized protein n=1 Tax=Globisporangium ultimum (strain ATCC 200006 / CBS 805.95 / DAOM BR144) TaxID=431595 RepID=K3WSC3_GLOUD
MDPYNKEELPQPLDETVQLDHIVEKQMMAYIFNRVAKVYGHQYSLEQIETIAEYVCKNIANADANLVLTKTTANVLKGAACWKFLDDLITDHIESRGLYYYFAAYTLIYFRQPPRQPKS